MAEVLFVVVFGGLLAFVAITTWASFLRWIRRKGWCEPRERIEEEPRSAALESEESLRSGENGTPVTSRRPWRGCAGLIVGAILLSGCGGTQHESAQVRSVVERYEAALNGYDGSEMCALLTSEAQHAVASLAASLSSIPGVGQPRGCLGYMNVVRVIAQRRNVLTRVRHASVGTVKIDRRRATVLVREPGAPPSELTLIRTPTGWKISLPPAATTPTFDLRGVTAIPVEPPPTVSGETAAQFNFGRAVVAQTGCLACHRISEVGNAGPGPDLTHIGSTRSSAAIERAILNPAAPMPSFRNLPKAKLRALVTFLLLLR